MSFTLKVKNGNSTYQWDEKKARYGVTKADLVDEYETLADALQGFLDWVGDDALDSKVSLSFTPDGFKKDKKRKKKQ